MTLRCGGLDHFSSLFNHLDDNIVHFFMDIPLGFSYFKHLKHEFDKLNLNKKIIFFIGDYSELPLKENSFDLLFDLLASSNYDSYDYSLVSKFLTPQNDYIGLYLTSDPLSRKDIKFSPTTIKNNFIQQGYKIEYEFLGSLDLIAIIGFLIDLVDIRVIAITLILISFLIQYYLIKSRKLKSRYYNYLEAHTTSK